MLACTQPTWPWTSITRSVELRPRTGMSARGADLAESVQPETDWYGRCAFSGDPVGGLNPRRSQTGSDLGVGPVACGLARASLCFSSRVAGGVCPLVQMPATAKCLFLCAGSPPEGCEFGRTGCPEPRYFQGADKFAGADLADSTSSDNTEQAAMAGAWTSPEARLRDAGPRGALQW